MAATTSIHTMASFALAYAEPNGYRPAWSVFPLAAGGKVPLISEKNGGHGCLDATTDKEIIQKWWKKAPRANIGLATGEINGFFVIDVDEKNGISGGDSLRDLEKKLGRLPDTVEALTANGGRHLFYKYPVGHDLHNATGIVPGVDVRANNGYVVAAPSILTNGGTYEWELSSLPNERPIAELPDLWLNVIFAYCEQQEKIPVGERNDKLFRFACSLRAQNFPENVIRDKVFFENKTRCAPPLPDREVNAILGSALKYPGGTPLREMLPSGEGHTTRERLTLAALGEEIDALGYAVAYNEISNSFEVQGRTATGRAMQTDDLITVLHDSLAGQYKGVSFEVLRQYLAYVGREHPYNPVRDLLAQTEWDGVDRLPQLYALIGISDDVLSKTLVKKWLMQSVALLFNDENNPFGSDGCLVLNGEQGAGKTSLFRHLALRDAWFGEGLTVDDRDKDTTRRVVSVWLAELGEVEATMKSDIASLKAFVSASRDRYRLPYAHSDIEAARRTSLCATCNSSRYLIDTSGNRRWWSIPFTRTVPREELLALDALQLWAQVYSIVAPLPYAEKASCFRLTEKERDALAKRNGEFEKPVKAELEVEDVLAQARQNEIPFRPATLSEFKESWGVLRPYSVQQIGVALRRCGIETRRTAKARLADLPIKITY